MEINCSYEIDYSSDGNCTYSCSTFVPLNVSITNENTSIKDFIGTHEPGKNNNDVVALLAGLAIINYFPKNLNVIFPNLRRLSISNAKLKKISRKDFVGLKNLTSCSLDNNQLTSLPSDLFVNTPKLKFFSFRGNELEHVSSDILRPIMETLRGACFNMNVFLNTEEGVLSCRKLGLPEGATSPANLMELIDSNFKKPLEDEDNSERRLLVEFRKLWPLQSTSFDFVVIADSEEFHVHERVLSIRSPVFAAMLTNDMQEKSEMKMTIQEFTAPAVRNFLRHLYTGEAPDVMNTMEVFELAVKYDVPHLKQICEELMIFNINHSNAYEVFSLGQLYNSEDIKASAFTEIKLMYPHKTLPIDLMEKPSHLKQLVEAFPLYQKRIQEVKEDCLKKLGDIEDGIDSIWR